VDKQRQTKCASKLKLTVRVEVYRICQRISLIFHRYAYSQYAGTAVIDWAINQNTQKSTKINLFNLQTT